MRESFRYPQGVKIIESKVYLPKIGFVNFRKSRDIKGTINDTTLTQEGSDWYISFSCEWEQAQQNPVPLDEDRSVGIDMGLTHFATIAEGQDNKLQTVENPRFLTTLLPRLRYHSRQLSKKAKNGSNRLKARLKLSKLHTRIKNLRNEFVHQLSAKMLKTHDIFFVESLDISTLLQNSPKNLSRSIADAGWRMFLQCLKYKSEECGKYLLAAAKYFPSSQICSGCSSRQKIPLSVRIYDCPCCGLKIARDGNSAILLKAVGMPVLKSLWSCPR